MTWCPWCLIYMYMMYLVLNFNNGAMSSRLVFIHYRIYLSFLCPLLINAWNANLGLRFASPKRSSADAGGTFYKHSIRAFKFEKMEDANNLYLFKLYWAMLAIMRLPPPVYIPYLLKLYCAMSAIKRLSPTTCAILPKASPAAHRRIGLVLLRAPCN